MYPPKNELRTKPAAIYIWEIKMPGGVYYYGPYLSYQHAMGELGYEREHWPSTLHRYTDDVRPAQGALEANDE